MDCTVQLHVRWCGMLCSSATQRDILWVLSAELRGVGFSDKHWKTGESGIVIESDSLSRRFFSMLLRAWLLLGFLRIGIWGIDPFG
ncbi:hypothetical protein T440DRAFT_171108 [Plenodomus tracheiphilus IPT5]|uniref:Uncharacterized protein n=1 Tax=Plenodomus tracheiphilus IPT5 TaxID=1408161 RepID=A0A6A7B160_9PLEO|nr:hypothetical protein T440DRAFT_171108 [Plenodomus tracheiphilus IPT5]